MDATFWIIVAELGAFAGFAVGTWVADSIERARWRRAAIYVWTRHPMNTTLPTVTELRQPEWIQPRP